MGLGAFIIGGALQGAGAGLNKQAEEDAAKRRDQRLAEARAAEQQQTHEYSLAENQQTNQLAADREAAASERALANSQTLKSDEYQHENALASASAAAKTQAAKDEEARQIRMKNLEFQLDNIAKARDAKIDVAKQAALEKIKHDLSKGEVQDVVTDGQTGEVSVVYKNGSGAPVPGITARPKPASDSTDFLTNPTLAPPKKLTAKSAAQPAANADAPSHLQMQHSVDAMLQSGSIPQGQKPGQWLKTDNGTVLTWDGKRWLVPGA